MENKLKNILEVLSNIVTILAFFWAIYEFYIKRRFKIKATASLSLLNLGSTELPLNFNIINLSDQSLKRIDYIGVWIKRWNSFGHFWEIALQDVGYQEKTKFGEDIYQYIDFSIQLCIKEQTLFDRLFKPKLKIVLKTTLDREIEVVIDELYKTDLENRIFHLFQKYEKYSKCLKTDI